MLVCLAISNDNYHKDNNLIHLVSSIFYTTDFNSHFEELTKINEINNLNTVVLRITRNPSLYFKTTRYSNTLAHIEISSSYFFELYRKNNEYSDFVDEIFQQSYQDLNTKTLINTGYKNILYVFEDLNWLEVQWLFKIKKVMISGGSQSNRQYLSSSEFNLSLYLYLLGYKDADIHESHNLAKMFKTKEAIAIANDYNNSLRNAGNFSIESLNFLLNTWYLEEEAKLVKNIQDLDLNIQSRKERINLTQSELSEKKKEILSQNKSIYNSKRVKRIEQNIRDHNSALLFKEKELSELNNQLLELRQRKDNLSNLSLTELKDTYFKCVHQWKKSKDLNMIKQVLSQTKKLGSAIRAPQR